MPTTIVNMEGTGKLLRLSPEELNRKADHILARVRFPIMLITVQHTGSRFFTSLLTPHYGETWPIWQPNRPFYFDHCSDANMDSIKARHAEGVKLITTSRNFHDTATSWERRQVQPLSEFKRQVHNYQDWVLPNADFVVAVDSYDRDFMLDNLADGLGISLTTDWKPVGGQ